jgi:hypothetical protein
MRSGALLRARGCPKAFLDLYATQWFEAFVSLRELAQATAIDCWGAPAPQTVDDVAMNATQRAARPSDLKQQCMDASADARND